jgi:uncharacterized membrane protein YphA (DoxX/SURF4 family)
VCVIYVIGVVLVVAGTSQILLRARITQANAAANSAMFNGRLRGPGFQAYGRFMAVVVGTVFVVAGILLLIFHAHFHLT